MFKRIMVVTMSVTLVLITVFAGNTQTFFIYEDDTEHQPPADRATVPLVALEGDSAEVLAYAGAVWGEHDLSGRDYCIAWTVLPSNQFDDWLADQGYRRQPAIAE